MWMDIENTNEWLDMADSFLNETENERENWFRGALVKIRAAVELARELGCQEIMWALLQRSIMRGLSVKYALEHNGWDVIMELTRCMIAEQGDDVAARLYGLAGERIKWHYEEDPTAFSPRPEDRIYEYGADAMRALCSMQTTAIRKQLQVSWGHPAMGRETYVVAIGTAILRMKGLLDVLCSLAPPSVGHRLCVEAFAKAEILKMVMNEGCEDLEGYIELELSAARALFTICWQECFPGVGKVGDGASTTEEEEGE